MRSLFIIGVLALTILNSCAAESIQLSNIYVEWEIRGTQTYFKLTTPLGNDVSPANAWIGLGLSNENAMNGASVVVCKNHNSKSAVHHYYNHESNYDSNLFDEDKPTLGISSGTVSVSGGNLTCSFLRDNTQSAEGYFKVRPGKKAYFLIAYGKPKSNGEIQYHAFRTVSNEKILFTNKSLKRTTTNVQPSNSYRNGQFTLSWTVKTNTVDFVYTMSNVEYKTNFYAAFAFSKDNYMGDDDVNVCIYSEKVKDVHHYCNDGKVSSLMVQSMPRYGIENASVSFANKVFTCKFSRKIKMVNEKYFDLSKPYYILLAHGPATSSGSIRKHIIKTASGKRFQVIPTLKRSAIGKSAFRQ